MTKFVNLTPHPVRLRVDGTNTTAIPAADDIVVPPHTGQDGKPAPARVSSRAGARMGDANGVPLFTAPSWGEVEGLPDAEADTIYIVSALVAGRVSDRPDVFSPGTGPADGAIRTDTGHIFSVTRLIQAG